MDNLLLFAGIVMITFGILQIILFFKIWGMTNNISNINKKISHTNIDDLQWQIRKALLKGDKQTASNLLFDGFISELEKIEYTYNSDEYISKLKDRYTKYFEKIGLPLPHIFENIKISKDVYNIF